MDRLDIESACFRHPYFIFIWAYALSTVWELNPLFWLERPVSVSVRVTAVMWPTGFEPAWFGTTIRCIAILPQPQYPMRGSNPTSSDWGSEIIPLDQSGVNCWNQTWTDSLPGMDRLLLPIKLSSISSRDRIRTCVILGMSQNWIHLQSTLRVEYVRFERLYMLPKHVWFHYTTYSLIENVGLEPLSRLPTPVCSPLHFVLV